MYNNTLTREVAILGLGLNSVKCTYYLKQKNIDIKYYLTNDKNIDIFCGLPVFELEDKPKNLNHFIVVATNETTYPLISNQLEKHGLAEFKDFIYWEWMYKKLVLLHGNCHMTIIKEFLMSSNAFCQKYSFYPNPVIFRNEKRKIEPYVCKNTDVWIHQDIRTDNEYGYYVSDEYIRKNIDIQKTKDITIPHLFGLGKAFYPQLAQNQNNNPINNGKDLTGIFPHSDIVIDSCIKNGMQLPEIIAYCKSDKALNCKQIVNNFNTYMNKIKEREKCWDIQIYDYIKENYHTKQLFYDPEHPTNDILYKICVDILKLLDIPDQSITCEKKWDICEEPIYPVVKNVLHLDFDTQLIRQSQNAKKLTATMDFETYIEQYIWWCHKKTNTAT